jgi:hypothetical protein
MHWIPHVPPVHVAPPLAGAGQRLPHVRQLFTSVIVSAHVIAQRVGAMGPHPLAHVYAPPPAPGVHTGMGSAHAARHAPQFVAVVRSVSQPSDAIELQSARLAAHALVSWHVPAVHRTIAASTPASAPQSVAHPPQ